MAAVCPVGFDTERLHARVLATCDCVVHESEGNFNTLNTADN